MKLENIFVILLFLFCLVSLGCLILVFSAKKQCSDNHLFTPIQYSYIPQKAPSILWTFWFGPPMLQNRKKCFDSMKAIGLKHIHITPENIDEYLKWPVHPAVKHLSGIHKSDYFRIYFLLHYGGGYSDIKPPIESWLPHLEKLNKDSNAWMCGVPETKNGIASPPGYKLSKHYQKLICNCFFIARPQNPYLQRVHQKQNEILDKHYENLIKHPPPNDRCCKHHENGYPLRWAEILGEIMAKEGLRFHKHFMKTMKMPTIKDYI